jgi:transcriptional regulator with XRE-family HTH domain
MAYRTRTHLNGDDMTPLGLVPKHLSKQAFAKRLYNLMIAKGWNQSELARRAGLQRDRISTYIRGQTLPTPQNVKAIADALGITPEELLPNHTEAAIEEDTPSLEMRVSTNDPSKAWLRVNRLVTTKTAAEVVTILNNDDVLARD